MSKKIVQKSNDREQKLQVSTLSLESLWVLFQIVSADYDRVAGQNNANAKGVISSRYNEVRAELYKRVYGYDPYLRSEEKNIEGMSPEKVLSGL